MVFLADSVLSNLLNFVGGGHYLFVGGVNRQWRSSYGKISQNKKGNLVTKYSVATASPSTLEYACACSLGLARDAFKLGSSDTFGPAVYAWARENGYPLLVWVTLTLMYSDAPSLEYYIDGVYSTLEAAKKGAIKEACSLDGSDREEVATYEWSSSRRNAWRLELGDFLIMNVEGFVVKDISYAKQIELGDRVPMYVFTEDVGCYPPVQLVGVHASKEAANRAVDERIAHIRADERYARGRADAVDRNKEADSAPEDSDNDSDGSDDASAAASEDERAGLQSYDMFCVRCMGALGSIEGGPEWCGYLKYEV